MAARSRWRGHPIHEAKPGVWVYSDTGQRVSEGQATVGNESSTKHDDARKLVQSLLNEQALYDRCTGTIKCDIRATYEYAFLEEYATLEIGYRCDTCGNTHFPKLPNDAHTINTWVEERIAQMPDSE